MILLIGGMSYETTLHYYEEINKYINILKKGNNDLELLIYSVNFSKIIYYMNHDNWKAIGDYFTDIYNSVKNLDVKKIILASNTIHQVTDFLPRNIDDKILNIMDCIFKYCKSKNLNKIGFLGTSYLNKSDYINKYSTKYNIEFVNYDKKYEKIIDNIIFDQLCKGIILENSKKIIFDIIKEMEKNYDVKGILLGCTELSLFNLQFDQIEVIDSAQLHIKYINEYLGENINES